MSLPTMTLNDDRLFPADPTLRGLAREIYATTRALPIISPHGHVPPAWLADDTPFTDPTSLLLTPDHYINRLLHASGVDLSTLGVGQGPLDEAASRAAFRVFCEHWPVFAGTVMRYWMVDQLAGIFGVTQRPCAESADVIYDTIAAALAAPDFRPRALMERFNIDFIATTDDPCDDLQEHAALAADDSFTRRVAPTFRPDKYLEPNTPGWAENLDRLAEVTGCDTTTLKGFTEALENRRAYFKAHGGISTDHGVADLGTLVLDATTASDLFAKVRAGQATPDEKTTLRRHLVTDQARMGAEDGLTMTIHPGVARNHDADAFATYGADVGGDIPVAVEATWNLKPLLNAYGNSNLKVVVFTMDETGFSREIAPLAGWYRSLYIGVPWWFIDAPESILRYKRAITEMGGFSRTSGMIDDTRAFCSIPARHDMSRRLDAVHLAELVSTHRLDLDEAISLAHSLVVDQPTKVFNL